MLPAREHVQLPEHAPAERVLRQHALDRELDHPLRVLVEELLEGDRLDPADMAGVMVVDLVGELATRDPDPLRVHHDDVIPHVYVRAVIHLVLALEAMGDLRRQTPERLVARVDDEPVAADGSGLGKYGLHGSLLAGRRPGITPGAGPKKGGKTDSSRSTNAKARARRAPGPSGAAAPRVCRLQLPSIIER